MLPKLRQLSAQDVLRALRSSGFEVLATRGSHAKLCRNCGDGTRQILTVPLNRHLAAGTLRAIYRQACRFIPEEELRPHFFR
jgi:predicted RNA binding protein YcfA (HicA-like mRNA interferase family)